MDTSEYSSPEERRKIRRIVTGIASVIFLISVGLTIGVFALKTQMLVDQNNQITVSSVVVSNTNEYTEATITFSYSSKLPDQISADFVLYDHSLNVINSNSFYSYSIDQSGNINTAIFHFPELYVSASAADVTNIVAYMSQWEHIFG